MRRSRNNNVGNSVGQSNVEPFDASSMSSGAVASQAGEMAEEIELDDETGKDGDVPVEEEKPDPFAPNFKTILLQGFHWTSHKGTPDGNSWYKELLNSIPEIVKSGVDHVWLPPPSHSVAPEGYLPQRLYDVSTPYGSEAELRELIAVLHDAGIKPMADVVINHRCADTQDDDGVWRIFSNVSFPEGTHEADKKWGPWAIVADDPVFNGEGNPATGAMYEAAPDIDHANERVRKELKLWLNWLKEDIGFGGWRFDYVKGYGAKFNEEYVRDTVGLGAFCVAEFWPDAAWEDGGVLAYDQNVMRQSMCDWIDGAEGASACFDFTTKAILQEAVKRTEYWRLKDAAGGPPGLIGWWPQRSVTFIDNHDTGGGEHGVEMGVTRHGSGVYGQGHWRFPPESRMVGYAYILTHPGMPCLFYPHVVHMPDGETTSEAAEVAKLSALRRAAGIRADSPVNIQAAEADLYVARIAGVNREVVLKIGPRFNMPADLMPDDSDGFELNACGADYAVWSRDVEWRWKERQYMW